MSKMKSFKNFVVDKKNGKNVFDIFGIIHEISLREGIDLDDMKNTQNNFDLWCEHKKLPEIDNDGKSRESSKIWFNEYQNDINNGQWLRPDYCSLLSFFTDYYTCDFDEIEEIDLDYLLKQANEKDLEQFGKLDYRTQAIIILKKYLDDKFLFTNNEC